MIGYANSCTMFSLVHLKVKLHKFQIIIQIRNQSMMKKKNFHSSFFGKFHLFQILQYYTKNVSNSRVSKYLWENSNISFTDFTPSDLQQAKIFWASMSCSRLFSSPLSRVFSCFCARCERILNRKKSEETYKSWTWMSKLRENTARYDYLFEKRSFTSKCLPSSFAIVASAKLMFCESLTTFKCEECVCVL